MPIPIEDSPEPLSEQSLDPRWAGELLLVESDATRVLRQELHRYCRGDIAGRSFLIAGHRGAGKTTLVAKAFLDTWAGSESSPTLLRPLFIPLHGPSLFPAPTLAADRAEEGTETPPRKAKAEPPRTPEKSEAQIALEQITLGLHRAVAREFGQRYYDRVRDLAELRRDRKVGTRLPGGDDQPTAATLDRLLRSLPPDPELFELAAQFEVELYEGPTQQRLREFWSRVDAVSGGVLFARGYAPRASATGNERPGATLPLGLRRDTPMVHEQGARELVALAGIVEAYRRISGEYKRSEQQKDDVKTEQQRSAGIEAGKELITPVTALLTGGLVGTGVGLSGTSPLVTVVSSLVAALGAAVVLKASTTQKRDRSSSREYQFIYDLSVATLDRALPILIERLRLAGLAPVFVVDELDKVKPLAERLVTMVHHLKKLVAENAFFCFLTNRSYFEEMLATGAGQAYPIEHTYYTHRLFVVFAPEDFEKYLRQRIPDPPMGLASPQTEAVSEEVLAETQARAILRWALRHRAQLHVGDLQREIAALRDDNGTVAGLPKELAASPRNLRDATAQVAIELRFSQPDVQQAAMDRPEFRRLLNDAMYYLSREWIEGKSQVDLSRTTGYAAFTRYLEDRTGRKEERATATAPNGLSETDLGFLFDQVSLLADFLSDRPSVEPVPAAASGTAPGASPATAPDWRREFRRAWNEQRASRGLPEVEATMWDVLLFGERGSLLIRDGDVMRFRYRLAGAGAPAASPPAPVATAPLTPSIVVTIPGPVAPTTASVGPPEAVTVAPASEPPASSEAAASSERPEWEMDAEFVKAVQASLLQVQMRTTAVPDAIEAPSSVVDLAALGGQFGVISPTPAWSVVHGAIMRLEQARGRGVPIPPEAVFQVKQFRDMLVRNGERIVQALGCAAVLGLFSGRQSRHTRIARGLRVIALAHGLAHRGEDEVGTALENVTVQVKRVFNIQAGDERSRTLGPGNVDDWAASIEDAIRASERLRGEHGASGLLDPEPYELQAWTEIHGRLGRWMTTGAPGDPEIGELVAAVAGRGPTMLGLWWDPREMRIADWVAVLAAVRRQRELGVSPAAPSAPPGTTAASPPGKPFPIAIQWVGVFALHALGFRSPPGATVESWFYRSPRGATGPFWDLDQRTWDLVARGVLLTGSPPASTLIAIRRTNSPSFGQMRPVSDCAALVATVQELESLLFDRTASEPVIAYGWLGGSPVRVVALEMEPELRHQLETQIYPRLLALVPQPLVVYVYAQEGGRDLRQPRIVKPAGPVEVVRAAEAGRTFLTPSSL